MIGARNSVTAKFTWMNILVSTFALVIACVGFIIYDQTTYHRILLENVSAQADVVGLNTVSALVFNDPEAARITISALQGSPNVLAATLFTADGKPFASYSRRPEDLIKDSPAPKGTGTDSYWFIGQRLLLAHQVISGNKTIGTVVILANVAVLKDRLLRYGSIAVAVLLIALLASLAPLSIFRRIFADPLLKLTDTARVVSREKDYSVRASGTRQQDEISVLIAAFNDMLSVIQSRDTELDAERARLKTIVDSAPIGIMVAEAPSGKIVLGNKKIEEMLHITTRDFESYSHWPIYSADGIPVPFEQRPFVRTVSTGEVVRSEEYIFHRPDGVELWIRASSAPVYDKSGKVIAAVLVLNDVTDQKKAHEALLRSEKLAAAGRLAASISHEINNPLESVTNLLFISLLDPSLSENTRRYLQEAEQELGRVSNIATQTLRFYRQSTKPTSADLGSLIDSVLRLLAARLRNSEITVVRDYRTDEQVLCFEGELRQVFTNLIGNAVDALAPGGCVKVRTKKVMLRGSGERAIQVTVADNGSGIPPDTVSNIFEPFYSTKGARGTGLGLWVSKEIVMKHRGRIKVRSRLGKGTVFTVVIPEKVDQEPLTVSA